MRLQPWALSPMWVSRLQLGYPVVSDQSVSPAQFNSHAYLHLMYEYATAHVY